MTNRWAVSGCQRLAEDRPDRPKGTVDGVPTHSPPAGRRDRRASGHVDVPSRGPGGDARRYEDSESVCARGSRDPSALPSGPRTPPPSRQKGPVRAGPMLHLSGVHPRLRLRRPSERFRTWPPALLGSIPILDDALPALGRSVGVLADKARRVTGTLWHGPHLLVVDIAAAASCTSPIPGPKGGHLRHHCPYMSSAPRPSAWPARRIAPWYSSCSSSTFPTTSGVTLRRRVCASSSDGALRSPLSLTDIA